MVSFAALATYVVPLPVYDHATPVPAAFAIFGVTATVALAYIFLRLWLWSPNELWFLHSIPWLASGITVAILWLAPSMIEPLVWAFLRSPRRSG